MTNLMSTPDATDRAGLNSNTSCLNEQVDSGVGDGSAGGGGVSGDSGNATMNNHEAYGWLEQPRHDPIATDTNLAEIDFEDFRNEDLAYAFSCGVSQCMHPFSHLSTLKVLIPLKIAMYSFPNICTNLCTCRNTCWG